MVSLLERIFAHNEYPAVREAYIARTRLEFKRIADFCVWMEDTGYVLINAAEEQYLTDDGREILRAHGKAWTLKPEIHTQRLAEAMALAQQRDAITKQTEHGVAHSVPPATCAALIDGQLCGGTLVNAAVCPRCALGKQGVAATLTCDVCGHVTAIMRGDA